MSWSETQWTIGIASGVGLSTLKMPTHHHRTTRVLMATVGQRNGGILTNQCKCNMGVLGMMTMSVTALTRSMDTLAT